MIPRHSKQVRLWRKALPCTISISQFVFLWTSAQSPRPRRFQQVSCLPSSASQKGAFSLRKYWSGLIFWKHVIHWGKVGLVAIRHCPLSPDSLPSQPFYWKAGAKLVAIQLGELVKAVRSSSSQLFFFFFFFRFAETRVISIVFLNVVCENSPQNEISGFPSSPVGLTAFLGGKVWKIWEMGSLKLGRKQELLTGDRLPFPCLFVSSFAAFSRSSSSRANHLPHRSCATLLQELLVAVFISSRSAAEKQL